MTTKTFSISIPVEFYDLLKSEADGEFRSLNNQISIILKERYHAHAPPVAPISKRSVSNSKSRNKQAGRKTKAEVN